MRSMQVCMTHVTGGAFYAHVHVTDLVCREKVPLRLFYSRGLLQVNIINELDLLVRSTRTTPVMYIGSIRQILRLSNFAQGSKRVSIHCVQARRCRDSTSYSFIYIADEVETRFGR